MFRSIAVDRLAVVVSFLFTTLSVVVLAEVPAKAGLTVPLSHVSDSSNNPITAGSPLDTLLYDAQAPNHPILTPDGDHVTLAEWLTVSGWASAKCQKKGTQNVIHLTGLIPNGVYTIWLFELDETLAFTGAGSLGPNDGSGNLVIANEAGVATVSIKTKAGDLSVFGEVGECLLDEAEIRLLGAYHLDHQTYGGSPGPGSLWTGQFMFVFVN